LRQIFQKNPIFITNGFDFPVNPPDAKKYYNAQPFGKNAHLGDDWNGTGGGNTDLGDSVYAIGNGVVVAAENYGGGWGNVVRIVHFLDHHPTYQFVESVYAHLDEIKIQDGALIKKGELIGTIGNANGQYWAHLHLEIRSNIEMPIGGGYSQNTEGYLNPTTFIKANRK
jgi:murein DD-endopeptidase MepM/ murein hydrolase activator NlpD